MMITARECRGVRLAFEVTVEEFAALVGCEAETVELWERGVQFPDEDQTEVIRALRTYAYVARRTSPHGH